MKAFPVDMTTRSVAFRFLVIQFLVGSLGPVDILVDPEGLVDSVVAEATVLLVGGPVGPADRLVVVVERVACPSFAGVERGPSQSPSQLSRGERDLGWWDDPSSFRDARRSGQ